ncbi:MAG: hypothetical protein K6A43_03700 [Treponema sp.]|nr:hypothetical protein [Treponema sp.]
MTSEIEYDRYGESTVWVQYFDTGTKRKMAECMESIIRAVRVFDVNDFQKNGNRSTISFKEACKYFYTFEGATDFAKKGITPKIGDIGPGG